MKHVMLFMHAGMEPRGGRSLLWEQGQQALSQPSTWQSRTMMLRYEQARFPTLLLLGRKLQCGSAQADPSPHRPVERCLDS